MKLKRQCCVKCSIYIIVHTSNTYLYITYKSISLAVQYSTMLFSKVSNSFSLIYSYKIYINIWYILQFIIQYIHLYIQNSLHNLIASSSRNSYIFKYNVVFIFEDITYNCFIDCSHLLDRLHVQLKTWSMSKLYFRAMRNCLGKKEGK